MARGSSEGSARNSSRMQRKWGGPGRCSAGTGLELAWKTLFLPLPPVGAGKAGKGIPGSRNHACKGPGSSLAWGWGGGRWELRAHHTPSRLQTRWHLLELHVDTLEPKPGEQQHDQHVGESEPKPRRKVHEVLTVRKQSERTNRHPSMPTPSLVGGGWAAGAADWVPMSSPVGQLPTPITLRNKRLRRDSPPHPSARVFGGARDVSEPSLYL